MLAVFYYLLGAGGHTHYTAHTAHNYDKCQPERALTRTHAHKHTIAIGTHRNRSVPRELIRANICVDFIRGIHLVGNIIIIIKHGCGRAIVGQSTRLIMQVFGVGMCGVLALGQKR